VIQGWLGLEEYAQAWAARGGDDPYLRPEYLEAAAMIGGGSPAAFAHGDVLYPFVVRNLDGGWCDLTSAYGAGGPIGNGDWRPAFAGACRERRVVSEFIRFHPLLQNHAGLAGVELTRLQDAITVDVRADDEGLLAQMEGRGRTAVRKALRCAVEVDEHRDLERFESLYGDTMRRIGARSFYLFDSGFFERLKRMGDSVRVLDAGTAAGLFLSGGGAMHYFLAGSTPEARDVAAANLVLFEAMRRARDIGLETLVLGGGLSEDDPLHRFKQAMGSGRAPLYIGTYVHEPSVYAHLCASANVPADTQFFPAYRRP
jgi:Acetyltransferase (GNAT) domain